MSGTELAGRTVVVTGGNSGVGKETAVFLAALGARVLITARNRAKGEAALADVRARTGSEAVELGDLDLASIASIRAFADQFLATARSPRRALQQRRDSLSCTAARPKTASRPSSA